MRIFQSAQAKQKTITFQIVINYPSCIDHVSFQFASFVFFTSSAFLLQYLFAAKAWNMFACQLTPRKIHT